MLVGLAFHLQSAVLGIGIGIGIGIQSGWFKAYFHVLIGLLRIKMAIGNFGCSIKGLEGDSHSWFGA